MSESKERSKRRSAVMNELHDFDVNAMTINKSTRVANSLTL